MVNNNDSGDGSLRQAIINATKDDTITFTNTLDGETILLISGQYLIDKNLDIDASALTNGIIIDGNGLVTSNRIFEITSNSTNVFDSLILTNGFASGASAKDNQGGAIYINATANLTLTNTTVSGNTTGDGANDDDGGDGGGIYNSFGTLFVQNSTISRNTTGHGGLVYGDYGNGGDGGGIYNDNGILIIQDSTLSENTTGHGGPDYISGDGGYGAGIYNNGTLTIQNSILYGNITGSGGNSGLVRGKRGSGAGIYSNGRLTVRNSTLSGNDGDDGGGIFSYTIANIESSTISGNIASAGGGIYSNGRLTVRNSTLTGNNARSGGGIYNNEILTVENSTLAENNASYGGGGIFLDDARLNFTNSIVTGNSAEIDPNISYRNASTSSGSNNLTVGDSRLAPLSDYGGPTQTMPPLPGSPAIDAGTNTVLTTDQRGFTRFVGSSVDIGAVEFQGYSDVALQDASLLGSFWDLDPDGDGNAFGVEYALGTDWQIPDLSNLEAHSGGGAAFGSKPRDTTHTAWVLKRSLDLVSDPFVEIYRYDGPTDTTTTNIPVSVNMSPSGIEVLDLSGATNAYYQFEAEISP